MKAGSTSRKQSSSASVNIAHPKKAITINCFFTIAFHSSSSSCNFISYHVGRYPSSKGKEGEEIQEIIFHRAARSKRASK
jgi:hypothetical protein